MNRTTRTMRLFPLLAAASLIAAGCTASKATSPAPVAKNPTAQPKDAPPPPISNTAKARFEDAVKSFDTQKKAKAFDYPALERKFKSALESDANLAEAEYNLGVIAERQGNIPEAKARYKAALTKKPSLRQASENLAVMEQNGGNVAGAVALYQEVLQRYPDDAQSRARLAEIYRQQNDHDKAMELARGALMRDPTSTTALKVMIRSYLDRKQLSMAKLVALRGVKLDGADPELHHSVGLIQLREGDADDARLSFKKALEAREDYVPSHVALAQLSLDAEDYPGAEEHLRRILQADGKNATAHLNLGLSYKGQGQYDKAMQEYDEAEKLDPELAAVHLNRAILLHKVKDAPERAVELYKRYIATAGGEVALSGEAPVFGLLREAEAIVSAKREAVAAEEQAKKMEDLQKKQQAQMQAAEKKQAPQAPAPNGAAAAPATGTGTSAQATPAGGSSPQTPAAPPQSPAAGAQEKKNAGTTDPSEPGEPEDDLL
ncbi:adventurous gliding motility TPR repeat lipoprotein GltE [Myxococcus llanfairpwllgwyngyllgogerychwyrndrobwllllantysiliogogogochensis]|uniref:Adventurous gliding motility TPR repeat lipoprotein GltE n=1 Tax=Myxococcus llanfairpwllgwyngyllgogerychwyrndrobwllllantysiliogogogochensis TaxID=2590453 RepID=A0A540WNY2_9BACT|nr:adventurous gliding motility TPR repeat lipoprotein GltE [Myxococcus llanfairpwllgwyngyllgogerychwyrndrobwllllantysiliogogogochensis]TQF10725.1 adventurous gliding motility TPR repeat lipoprotein GltE [Myxococcus llanfairpwllgwyngyllgogerychwyrndrobwllllantysiliogogogochensis]